MELKNIKLIIWDLDETFWKGTISEEKVEAIKENIEFLKNTTDMGIINSICSKNDFDVAKKQLESLDVWQYFVFASINWEPKGKRIKDIISTMKLRSPNVLFIDDNIQNLKEAEYFCDGIMTALPDDISELMKEAMEAEHKDRNHTRLKQYRQLEEMEAARSEFGSNEEFLYSCQIKVDIHYDCFEKIDRVHELIMRSNQLNYTKNRQSMEELREVLEDKDVKSGYVTVADRFGDYGIVGFFAIKNNTAIHYVFSCRTLGMRVEQYVYSILGYPKIDVVGDVVSILNSSEKPEWINCKDASQTATTSSEDSKASFKVLIKGPCDMSQMHAFLNSQNVVTEFTYTNDAGVSVEGHNHTSQIVTSLFTDEIRKKEILSDAPFFDSNMLTTSMADEKFDYIVLSMLTDGNLGVYRRKSTGEEIALCEKAYSLVDEKNSESYKEGLIFTSGISFTEEMLKDFSERYDYIENTDGALTIANLEKIYSAIDKETVLILLLGSEREYAGKTPSSYKNRHLYHIKLNNLIKEWAKDKSNVIVLPYDKYIKSDSDFIDTINHFTKKVYYELAVDLMKIFKENSNSDIEVKGRGFLLMSTVKQKLRMLKSRLKNLCRKK